jgi:DNA-binding transcriptional ArsR family regulator
MKRSTEKTGKKSKSDVLFHPVRMRILFALTGRELTAQGIAEEMADVPQATLYRHINRLVQEGVLVVSQERQVRGTVERTFALNRAAVIISPDDLRRATADDHEQYFAAFVSTLLADFTRYRATHESGGHLDVVGDGVAYSKVPLLLSDDEFLKLSEAYRALIAPHLANSPTPERRRRWLTTIVVPDAEVGESAHMDGSSDSLSDVQVDESESSEKQGDYHDAANSTNND